MVCLLAGWVVSPGWLPRRAGWLPQAGGLASPAGGLASPGWLACWITGHKSSPTAPMEFSENREILLKSGLIPAVLEHRHEFKRNGPHQAAFSCLQMEAISQRAYVMIQPG